MEGNFSNVNPSNGTGGTGGGCAPLSLGADRATRRCTRLRTFRRVSIGFLWRDLWPMDSESESDSHTDCSGYAASERLVMGRRGRDAAWLFSRVGDSAVSSRVRGDDVAGPGLGTGLGQSLAGMKKAWSKCEAWGSIVTGSIKLGGEIMDGSIWARWLLIPPEWCPFLPCPSLILGNEGNGFPRRL